MDYLPITSDVNTTINLATPARSITIGSSVTVDADGTIHCLNKQTPQEFEVSVVNAGMYGGLLRAIWIAGKCGS
jgi:hypothetical protein